MIIVDTSVWIDFLDGTQNPQTAWLESKIDQKRIGLTDLILCEILQGISEQTQFASTLSVMERFAILESGGYTLAVASARNYRILRAKGYTIRKTIDCLIATFCLREGHTLLHRDRDFDLFEQHLGLHVIHPEPVA